LLAQQWWEKQLLGQKWLVLQWLGKKSQTLLEQVDHSNKNSWMGCSKQSRKRRIQLGKE